MADTPASLEGARVWVTRPRGMAAPLASLVHAAGGAVVHFPLVEIAPVTDVEAARAALSQLAPGTLCIFVSRNAVQAAIRILPALVTALAQVEVFAVGAGTAAELATLGVAAGTGPGPAYGAADLLTRADFARGKINGREILVVRGVGGEPGLLETLADRGAKVRLAEVYRRLRPAPAPGAVESLWRDTPPDIIVLTSAGAVATLLDLTPAHRRPRLLQTPLAVISARVATAARNAGFAGPVLTARGATDAAMMETLRAWKQDR